MQTTTFRNGASIYKIDSSNQFLDTSRVIILNANCIQISYSTNTYNNNGTYLPTDSVYTSAYTWPSYDSSLNANNYGALYNYYAVSDPNELCPTGWHVPTDCEWMYLENTLGLTASEQQATGARGSNQGGMLKSINSWAAPNTWATNNSGFNGKPAGVMSTSIISDRYNYHSASFPGLCLTDNDFFQFYRLISAFSSLTINTSWWTSNDYYYREVGNSFGGINRSNNLLGSINHNYRSIRCLKD